jgi:hypothetical protein
VDRLARQAVGARRPGCLGLLRDTALELLEPDEGTQAPLGLVVGFLREGAEDADEGDALQDVRELSERKCPVRRRARRTDGREPREDEPDGCGKCVRAVDPAAARAPHREERREGCVLVVVAEPVAQAEDADLFAGGGAVIRSRK